MGVVFLGEATNALRIAGILLAGVSVVLMSIKESSRRSRGYPFSSGTANRAPVEAVADTVLPISSPSAAAVMAPSRLGDQPNSNATTAILVDDATGLTIGSLAMAAYPQRSGLFVPAAGVGLGIDTHAVEPSPSYASNSVAEPPSLMFPRAFVERAIDSASNDIGLAPMETAGGDGMLDGPATRHLPTTQCFVTSHSSVPPRTMFVVWLPGGRHGSLSRCHQSLLSLGPAQPMFQRRFQSPQSPLRCYHLRCKTL